jgi:O-antigen/teichoic acid export membrane protein
MLKNSFVKDTLKLASGTLFAQVLTILAAPVLTRLYSAEAFGALALYFSVVNIVSETAALRYDLSIVLPENDREAANQFAVGLLWILVIHGLLFLAFVFLGRPFVETLHTPGFYPYLWAVIPGTLATAIFFLFNYWCSRFHRFHWLSTAAVLNTLTMLTVQLIFGLRGDTSARGLVYGSALGPLVTALYLAIRTLRRDGRRFASSIRWDAMKLGMARYQKFPRYDLGGTLLSLVAWQIPQWLLAFFFSSTVLGFYSVGMRLLQVPIRVVGLAIGQAVYPTLVEAHAAGTLAQVTEAAFRRLASLTLFPMLALTIAGRDLFFVVFGPGWQEAGVYVQILGIWVFFWFISFPLGSVFSVLEIQEWNLRINALNLVTRLVSFLIGGLLGNVYIALLLFAGSGILVYAYYSATILFSAGVRWRRILAVLKTAVLSPAPLALLLLGVKLFGSPAWLVTLALAAALGLHLYYFFRHDHEFWTLLRSGMLKGKTRPEGQAL